jgi:hypothetical protein
MPVATLGDFLRAASADFERAASPPTGIANPAGAIRQLDRITHSLTRYLDSTVRADAEPGSSIARLRRALVITADELEEATALTVTAIAGTPTARIVALTRAADALAAGADLVATHTATGLDGQSIDRSDWAQVMRTQPFTDAITAEVTHWADQIAGLCQALAYTRGIARRPARCLISAGQALRSAAAAVIATTSDTRDDVCHVLCAVPAATLPVRRPPTGGESAVQLCDGIAISSARLKAAAFSMAEEASWSACVSAAAWRRTSHLAASAMDLSLRALQHSQDPSFRVAVLSLDAACESWRRVTGLWQVTATDTNSPQSPAATEAHDLTQRLERLVNTEAGDKRNFTQVLSAIHRATDAIARMAGADLHVIRCFAQAHRFYTPARTRAGKHAQSRGYVLASDRQVRLLTDAYQLAARDTSRAADILDELVLRRDAPSKPLAITRKALLHDQPDSQSARRTNGTRLSRGLILESSAPAVTPSHPPDVLPEPTMHWRSRDAEPKSRRAR